MKEAIHHQGRHEEAQEKLIGYLKQNQSKVDLAKKPA
jgi:hypothetical protein